MPNTQHSASMRGGGSAISSSISDRLDDEDSSMSSFVRVPRKLASTIDRQKSSIVEAEQREPPSSSKSEMRGSKRIPPPARKDDNDSLEQNELEEVQQSPDAQDMAQQPEQQKATRPTNRHLSEEDDAEDASHQNGSSASEASDAEDEDDDEEEEGVGNGYQVRRNRSHVARQPDLVLPIILATLTHPDRCQGLALRWTMRRGLVRVVQCGSEHLCYLLFIACCTRGKHAQECVRALTAATPERLHGCLQMHSKGLLSGSFGPLQGPFTTLTSLAAFRARFQPPFEPSTQDSAREAVNEEASQPPLSDSAREKQSSAVSVHEESTQSATKIRCPGTATAHGPGSPHPDGRSEAGHHRQQPRSASNAASSSDASKHHEESKFSRLWKDPAQVDIARAALEAFLQESGLSKHLQIQPSAVRLTDAQGAMHEHDFCRF